MLDHALLPACWSVVDRRRETADTVTLTMAAGDGTALRHLPGQFNMLYAFGIGEVPISISSDPEAGALRHTVRAVGAVSRALCAVDPGAVLGLRGPFGSHWPRAVAHGRDVVVMAGGIGLAPLRPLIERLVAERERFGRLCLLYGAREPSQMLFAEDRERWAAAGMQVLTTVDRADAAWTGRVGVVTELLQQAGFDGNGATAYLCGPEIMMRFGATALQATGITPERIWVSLERNMQCAVGTCGHCQFGTEFICRDGAVFRFDRVAPLLRVAKL